LYQTLQEMGGQVAFLNERIIAGEKVANIEVKSSRLKGIEVPTERAPSMIDEYPILAIASACTEGKTIMHGVGELRVKDSDRLSPIINGINPCGIQASAQGDTLTVQGGKIRGGVTISSQLDHRIAMAFLVLGMVSEQPISIDDASTINTSFPGFAELMNGI